jgi:hypothetical protein
MKAAGIRADVACLDIGTVRDGTIKLTVIAGSKRNGPTSSGRPLIAAAC